MKILISTYDDIKNPTYGGGGAIAIHELAKRLKAKHDVTIISWNHSKVKNETIHGVEYSRIGLSIINPKIAMFVFHMILPFYALTRKHDFWIEGFYTSAFLPLFTRKPVVGVVHMLAGEDIKRKYKIDLSIIENTALKLYKNIVTTQEVIKRKILEINPKCKVTVISNGIEKVYAERNERKKQILFLGRLEVDQKGLDLLIDAFSKFSLVKPEYKLVIAGSGAPEELEKLKGIVKKFGLEDKVDYAGRVEGEVKESIMKESKALVLTSRFETFSMVALESLAFGLPLVTFDIEGLKWIPDNAVRKAKAFDTANLSLKMTEVIKNEKLQKDMRLNGLKYAEKFTWDNIAKQYIELIDEITNAKR